MAGVVMTVFAMAPSPGRGGGSNGLGIAIAGILILVVILFICREVMCWYWKINRIVELLEQIAGESEKPRAQVAPPVRVY